MGGILSRRGWRRTAGIVILLLFCGAAAGYQLLALVACIRHAAKRDKLASSLPGVSILKPLSGGGEQVRNALLSHANIEYPRFEVLLGVRDGDAAARILAEELLNSYPQISFRMIQARTNAPNAKVGTLEDLARHAAYPLSVVNDADISVSPDYLKVIAAALDNPAVGLVTCLYKATATSFATRWEALGIATDFVPSALVAPLVGVREFGLGATLAFRKDDFDRAGGFTAIEDYLADDYQLGRRVAGLGLVVTLPRMVVSTDLGGHEWASVWRHQVRWARTIRLSRPAYFGLPITNATIWSLIAGVSGMPGVAATLLLLRMITGLVSGLAVLRDGITARWWWLVPFRDLFGFAVWVAGAVGREVEWRGHRLKLDREGRIISSG